MKILHISRHDVKGGAAIAAYRLHSGLISEGIESRLYVQNKISNDSSVTSRYKSDLGKKYAKFRSYLNNLLQRLQKTDNPTSHSGCFLPSGLHKIINNSDADIVHLHWINGEMISVKEISKIKKPIVWTLHDMWIFCGAEHIDNLNSPYRYREGYKKKNRPKNHSGIDIDRWTWKRKRKYWMKGVIFNLVTPSSWLAECVFYSQLFNGKHAIVIPNGLDTQIFKPIEKKVARRNLNLPDSRQIILSSATPGSNTLKGFKALEKALDLFEKRGVEKGNLLLCIFGRNESGINNDIAGIETVYLGSISNNETLSLVYSAADVMISPSFVESFGQTLSESMACGTPVVAFDTSGIKDIIDHKVNGYLAKPFSPSDLATGIEWVLQQTDSKKLTQNARNKVLNLFDLNVVTQKYLNLYAEILENKSFE